MTEHNWKPGDVVIIDADYSKLHGERGVVVQSRAGWAVILPEVDTAPLAFGAADLRPLVVIDPEDREHVERLTNALDQFITSGDDYADGVQAALREIAAPTPPKPDEPQGLGAVVEDAEGEKWVRAGVRINDKGDDWRCVGGHHVGYWSQWSNLAAVRVLSEGVVA